MAPSMTTLWLVGGDFNVVLNAEEFFERLDRILINHEMQGRFLKFWVDNPNFLEVVKQNWSANGTQNTWFDFKDDTRRVKAALTKWSRDTYGDIFKQIITREDIVKIKERLFDEFPNAENRKVLQRAHAEHKKYLHFEEIFWQQKSGYDWFKSGEKNTRFFHSIVKGRRRKLQIQRIQNDQGAWLNEAGDIAEEAVIFY
ncbi:hypothetical protein KY290_007643 [Solanum tuberosum]|uniref:Uncharacterized protein n=1 Tax=Solanum tuberosum TaxID=4113 RepID=A0ABQ7W6A4_SOLTU|nr:hypothetical protein KY290_007643 [Solanum tuberosum]